MNLSNRSDLLQYLKQHGLWAKKNFSQNFLVDREALDKIVEAADLKEDDFVVEVGPGTGVLTEQLVEKAKEVSAVELDSELAELLRAKFLIEINNSKLKILKDDILRVNLSELIGTRAYKVVANIPYAITSKIFQLFLSREHRPEVMVLLVQKEVAERICAKPGDYSKLAISVQIYGRPEIVGIVKKESFFPSPKVDSAILKIVVGGQSSVVSEEQEKEFFRTVHIGFASRRKTLANNLSSGYQLDKDKAIDIIKKVGLRQDIRAQDLSIQNWIELTGLLSTN